MFFFLYNIYTFVYIIFKSGKNDFLYNVLQYTKKIKVIFSKQKKYTHSILLFNIFIIMLYFSHYNKNFFVYSHIWYKYIYIYVYILLYIHHYIILKYFITHNNENIYNSNNSHSFRFCVTKNTYIYIVEIRIYCTNPCIYKKYVFMYIILPIYKNIIIVKCICNIYYDKKENDI